MWDELVGGLNFGVCNFDIVPSHTYIKILKDKIIKIHSTEA